MLSPAIILAIFPLLALASPIAKHQHEPITLPLTRRALSSSSLPPHLAKRGLHQVPINGVRASQYTVSVNVGGSAMGLGFSTSSADTWVISTRCNTAACNEATGGRFKSDVHNTSLRFNARYGIDEYTGGARSISGDIGLVSMSLANTTVKKLPFVSVDELHGSWEGYSGILAAAPSTLSETVAKIFQAQLSAYRMGGRSLEGKEIAQKFRQTQRQYMGLVQKLSWSAADDTSIFTVDLASGGDDMIDNEAGFLTLGGIPSHVNTDEILYVNVIRTKLQILYPAALSWMYYLPAQPTDWQVWVDGFKLNNEPIPPTAHAPHDVSELFGPRPIAMVDSTVTGVYMPHDQVAWIYTKLGGNITEATVPCEGNLDLSLVINNKDFPIKVSELLSIIPGRRDGMCSLQIRATNMMSMANPASIILGEPFFKSVVTVFDYGNRERYNRIGFYSTYSPTSGDAFTILSAPATPDPGLDSRSSTPIQGHGLPFWHSPPSSPPLETVPERLFPAFNPETGCPDPDGDMECVLHLPTAVKPST